MAAVSALEELNGRAHDDRRGGSEVLNGLFAKQAVGAGFSCPSAVVEFTGHETGWGSRSVAQLRCSAPPLISAPLAEVAKEESS